ncbi:uncharacterized protein LOC119596129 isoform X3 [Penaeus monodon]|uniref:uncharacterized protein LOC119596129 isoform X3 n=1 Tax=Penaeus monodon TaxID=6687 RepID=UPI0018A73B25|nr:uncharacterized protein LOC119596129 isoform X3 [Penaeus monodon]
MVLREAIKKVITDNSSNMQESESKPEMALVSRAEVAQANAMARQLHVYKPGIDFVPGARLEVLDTRDNNWYQCKVVEVDWGELDILVHYERWSNRFDEWLKMDSTRIRPVVRSSSRKEKKGGIFRIGDKVTARWAADGKRYQARITKVLGDDQYEVLFFDGVTKVVRSGALTKFEKRSPRVSSEHSRDGDEMSNDGGSPRKQSMGEDEEIMLLSPAATTASSTDSRPSSPEPDQTVGEAVKEEELSEVETVTTPVKKSIFEVEIIDQKRKPKRKAAVEELFQSFKKKRRYEYHGKKDDASPKTPHTPLSSQAKKASTSKKRGRDSMGIYDDDGAPLAGTSKSWEPSQEAAESTSCESPMPSQSMNTVLVDVEDGWKKCCTRRTHGTTAGKWDMFYITPEGKKIRSKNDLSRYFEDAGLHYDIDKFDFSVKNMKDVIEAHLQEMEHKELQRGSYAAAKEAKETPKEPKDTSTVELKLKEEPADMKEDFTVDPPSSTASTSSSNITTGSGISGSSTKPSLSSSNSTTISASSTSSTSATSASSSTTAPAPPKKPDGKRTESKHADTKTGGEVTSASRVKIEIPIMPKTEPLGTLASSLLHSPTGTPWPSPSVSHGNARILPPAPSTSLAALDTMADQSTVATGPQTSQPESGTPPTVTSTPTSALPGVAGSSKATAAAPPRAKQTVKKEPVLAPNEFVVLTEHNEHQCPKSGCGKSFRKENLLQMHIKHYHPEILKKNSSWAPNVADLAYARTVGDHLDLTASPTHSSSPVEKVLKGESLSKKSSRAGASGSPGDTKLKSTEKKAAATLGGASSLASTPKHPKEPKKKELLKQEPSLEGFPIKSEDELEVKEDLDDYIDDLEDDSSLRGLVKTQDPDYDPNEGVEQTQKKKKSKSKVDPKTSKKRKSVPSESMSEDDQQETKAVTKYRYSKRKGSAAPKVTSDTVVSDVSSSNTSGKKLQYMEAESSGIEVEEDTTDTWVDGGESASVQEAPAEIINCGCGSAEEEGLMLQCDVCLCWQHGACYNILSEEQVPDKYICSLCDHPRLERSSHKFRHHQDWVKEGRLPRFSFSRTRGDARLETCVRRGHELTANVLQLSQVLHSLRLKLHIAKEADHPKFVMWHKKWIEKKEGNGQGEKAGTSSDPETIGPLPADLMDIVGPDGPSLNPPPLGSSVIPDETLNEGIATPVGMSQAGMPNPPNTSTSMELALTPTPASGVWGIPGDMPSVQQIADQTFESAVPSTEFSKKVPASDVAEIEGETIPGANQNIKEDVGGSKTEDLDTSESQASSTEATREVTDTSKEGCPPDTSEISSAVSAEEKTGKEENKEQKMTKEQMETVDASDNSKANITNKHSEVSKKASSETSSDQIPTKTQSEPPTISKEEGETEASEDTRKNLSSEVIPEGGPTSESLTTDKRKETHDQREGTDSAQETCTPEEEKQGEEIRSKEAKNSTKEENEEDPEANKSQKDEAGDKKDTEIAETKPSGDTKGTESEETIEKEMTQNLGDIELPQEEDIVAADLPQTEEIDAPGDVLDDDDEAQLDDGDDLAAALLSSQTELEQLVTQASSALSPHVSTPSLEPQVVAPIIPEAERIEPVNCKLNLLEHVQVMQSNITKRFDEIEKQLEVLEAEMGLSGDTGNDDCEEESEERDPATLQARALVKLILNDINTVKKIAEFTH